MKKILIAAIAALLTLASCGDTKTKFGNTGYNKINTRDEVLYGVEDPAGNLIIEKGNLDIKCYPDTVAGLYFIAQNISGKYDFYDKSGKPLATHIDTFQYVKHPVYPHYRTNKSGQKGFLFYRENLYTTSKAASFELDKFGNIYAIDAEDGQSFDLIMSRSGKELIKVIGGQIGTTDGKYITLTAKPKTSLYDKKGQIIWRNAVYTFYDTNGNLLEEKISAKEGRKIFE